MDERPTTEDLLERGEFIRRLGNALVKDDNSRATGVVVGITGEWGSGKSSILKMAATHLENERGAIVIAFDPWIISGRDDLIERLLIQIATRLGLRKEKWAKKLGKSVAGYVEALGPATDALKLAANVVAPGSGVVAGGLAKIIGGELGKTLDIHQQREELKAALEKAKVAIIVMIDEIDRVDDAEIRAVAQFVRAVADFDRISYLLAYDQKRVAEALGSDAGWRKKDRIERGTAYLEKIVQYQVPLPVLVRGQLLSLFDQFVSPLLLGGWKSDPRWQQLADLLFPDVLGTPRDIKRLGGAVQIRCMLGEIDPVDLLGWCALQIKCPQVIDVIRSDPALVGGPDLSRSTHNWERFVGRSPERLSEQFLARFNPSQEIVQLLDFLFPTRWQRGSTEGRHPDCLCFERPLMTVLLHGIPQGYFSRTNIFEFLAFSPEARLRKLTELMDSGEFNAFFRRLSEVYPEITSIDQIALWHDLAVFLAADTAFWPTDWTFYHYLGDELLQMVLAGGRHRFESIAASLHDASLALSEDGDWHILPSMLHHNLFAHGLHNYRQSREGMAFLSGQETDQLCQDMSRRLVSAALSDDFQLLCHLRSPIPLFIAGSCQLWPIEARTRLTEALGRTEVLDALTLLFFGGRYIVGRRSLEPLLDVDAYIAAAHRRIESLDDMSFGLGGAYAKIRDRGISND